LLLYLAAGVAYTGLGVAFPVLLYSWVGGTGFLMLAVCVLPALWRRLRR
jgi:hypothetical protein